MGDAAGAAEDKGDMGNVERSNNDCLAGGIEYL